ncbi:hypothetical protein SeMB42_g05064 [Synchytrium endobioticum]|uniref:Uncharacterized protein n=1 Tax=Synchytrium endobioticum TaxID=286115 RepID=A0A507CTV8_9FUNG|nr:hypothetical protein SeMB42_g05064 [Synchytrium endobioticum]
MVQPEEHHESPSLRSRRPRPCGIIGNLVPLSAAFQQIQPAFLMNDLSPSGDGSIKRATFADDENDEDPDAIQLNQPVDRPSAELLDRIRKGSRRPQTQQSGVSLTASPVSDTDPVTVIGMQRVSALKRKTKSSLLFIPGSRSRRASVSVFSNAHRRRPSSTGDVRYEVSTATSSNDLHNGAKGVSEVKSRKPVLIGQPSILRSRDAADGLPHDDDGEDDESTASVESSNVSDISDCGSGSMGCEDQEQQEQPQKPKEMVPLDMHKLLESTPVLTLTDWKRGRKQY